MTSLIALATACGHDDDPPLDEHEQEVLVGSFVARFDDTLPGGGVVAEGVSLSGRLDMIVNTSGNITIAGIPAGSTVQRALLYWGISGGLDNTATINGFAVTGTLLATAGETCFGAGVNNTTYRADVTARVTGNGVFTIAGLPSSVTATAADTDGAALVVVYQNATSGIRRRVMIRDGAITSTGVTETATDTFTGVAAPIASAGRFHIVVGDGQSAADGNLVFNAVTLGTNQFPGNDGSLMDVASYNMTVPSGLGNGVWSSTTSNDCLFYMAAAIDWNVGVCGDGVRTGGEACENGNTTNGDGCSSTCTVEPGWTCTAGPPSVCTPICGDGIRTGSETCDQGGGNVANGDGCSATCQVETGWTCTGTPSVCTAVCGDGIRTGPETCDQGGGNVANGDGCSSICRVETGWTCVGTPSVCTTTCGDGIRAGAEQCDQGGGNVANGDGCSSTCAIETGWSCTGSPSVCVTTCGDGIRAGPEQCDQGNTTPGDGCSATCTIEPGWTCTGNTPSVCVTTCGDGVRAGTEQCDQGNTTPGDGCSATCTIEPGWTCTGNTPSVCMTTCGDGIRAGAEQCDDAPPAESGDGCSATCTIEPGWTCTGNTPSVCVTACGDGVIAGTEVCDDGNTGSGDGCSATCAVEPGWTCVGAPSRCTTACGDGVVAGIETCDDGGVIADDGCSATCTIEPGWTCTGSPSACDEICGDGLVVGAEACDDAPPAESGDGCSATCTIEPGWSCTGEPSVCTPNCNDNMIDGSETCDDGNNTAGDGCSATCQTEPGWDCTDDADPPRPMACVTVCGDSIIVTGQEECDDGNPDPMDGCDIVCDIEPDYICVGTPSECEPVSIAGGGCASTSGGSGLATAAGLLLLALMVRRRRGAAALLAVLAVVAIAPPASAQELSGGASYPAERFRLAMDRDGVLGVEAAKTPGHLVLDIGFWLGYANDPLTVRVGEDHEREGALVADRYGGDLVVSVGIGKRLELGLAAPVIVSQSENLGALMTTGDLSGLGFGDLAITPKVSLLTGGLDVALAATVGLPTSGADNYFGEDAVTVTPQLLIGRRSGAARLLLNLGYRVRGEQEMVDLKIGNELLARAGLGYRAGRADLMVELAFATSGTDPFANYNDNHGEVRGGLGVDLVPGLRLFAAGGVGIASGWGTPDWRALGGVWFGAGQSKDGEVAEKQVDSDGDGIWNGDDKCVTDPENKNGFEDEDGCPDTAPDADNDGILVPVDQCPAEAETRNSYQDDDGCPDSVPDTDGDGLSDPTDSCPDSAEDKDAFEDDDGCPEEDNDKDGVTDLMDRCPMEAGVVENGGCPDTDRDGDTVVDRLDNCPDEPGTVKNYGCKDRQLVVFKGGTIDLLDIVYFKTNKAIIEKRSFKLLTNVAKVVGAHPEIKKITVEGHTDNQGDDAYNKDLSQRRAEAVVNFLVEKGIAADILTPIGYGEEIPIKDNRTKKGRAANRRVEFKLEGITGNSVQTENPLKPRTDTPTEELP